MVGLEALRGLAEELYGERDPGEIFYQGHVQEIVEEGDDYVLKLTLPHMEMEKVRLTKRGDELFVTVGNFKRELLLPTMLAHRNASRRDLPRRDFAHYVSAARASKRAGKAGGVGMVLPACC